MRRGFKFLVRVSGVDAVDEKFSPPQSLRRKDPARQNNNYAQSSKILLVVIGGAEQRCETDYHSPNGVDFVVLLSKKCKSSHGTTEHSPCTSNEQAVSMQKHDRPVRERDRD